jgi:[ribosomal protein S5]-alanine N-acetyltransferase
MINLCDLQISDIDDLHQIMKNPKVALFLPGKSYESVDKVAGFFDLIFKSIRDQCGYAWLIVDQRVAEMQTIGLVDLLLIDSPKSIGSLSYLLSEVYWGQGIGTAVIKTLIPKAFNDFGLKKLIAPVVSRNIGSIKVLKKNGFVRVEKRKKSVNFDGKPDSVEIYELVNPNL